MAKISIEVPDSINEFIEREVALGRYESASKLIESVLNRAKWRADVEDKLEEALDECERGDCATWTKGDFGKLGEQTLQQRTKVP